MDQLSLEEIKKWTSSTEYRHAQLSHSCLARELSILKNMRIGKDSKEKNRKCACCYY
jgi:hypothetical protein